jgi:RNA polymerase sigma factor (sigma-70 family)
VLNVDSTDVGALAADAAAGDPAAWRGLVARFSGLLWSITQAYRLTGPDAADVFQTTWLRLAEHIHRIENPGQVGAWLATTARHECLRCVRASARTTPVGDMIEYDHRWLDDQSPEQTVIRMEQARLDEDRAAILWREFARLSQRCRHLLRVLMASPPPSYAEVSAALDMPIGSIGPTRARCLSQLRARLAEVSGFAQHTHEDR